jgi:site-specific DNA-cytosine methylase
MIAHPPCTHLSVSGARWFKEKKEDGRQLKALEFFLALWNSNIWMVCLENPVSLAGTKIGRPTQIIQPYQYGDPQRKTTCLWLRNLPKLKPTKIVKPKLIELEDGSTDSEWHYNTFRLPKEQRGHERSRTFHGRAMG